MTNTELLEKMSQNIRMRNFSPHTYDFYIRKTKEMKKLKNTLVKNKIIDIIKNMFKK